ncbi:MULTISPECIES: protein phosphatase 2C domain-containing protein [Ignavibacterium]|jgi:protein phosphatase|uniref:PP2C family protein-serine/threonine phosphatase n=1 Tax=Ignavibacterium TaxID=795750 RepID=UPI0025B85DB9|nr:MULTISPECIES: protein phosphatase 2C domain-containing protein [Ignavibacterium]MBI5661018.1 serine/threonine-protein phosphatase [Ignavibacterium album]
MDKYLISKFTARGNSKSTNEDAIETVFIDDGLLCILCDGVGADSEPEVASRITINAVKNLFDASRQPDYLERIKETILDANDFLLKYSQQKKDSNQMTTTLEILYLKNNFAYWGHLGDSRIYYLKGNLLRLLTKDHTLIQKLLEEGYLTLKQATNHPNSNIILKALGKENPEPDLSKMRLGTFETHRFFLCSDGVTNLINEIELKQILTSKDFESIQNKIISLVRSRGAFDDYSFILIEKLGDGREENS